MPHRETAQRHHQRWPDEVQLPLEVPLTCPNLSNVRVPVSRRAALHDVGDEHRLSIESNAPQKLVEKPARPADKRLALLVLLSARALADEEDLSVRRAGAWHRVRPSAVQLAVGACAYLRSNGS